MISPCLEILKISSWSYKLNNLFHYYTFLKPIQDLEVYSEFKIPSITNPKKVIYLRKDRLRVVPIFPQW